MTHAFRGGRGSRPLVPSRATVDDEKVSLGAATMPSEYAKALGARLRAIRTQQGLSLHGVEEKSRGRWKAVVVGSYERGDRAVTVQKLSELAEFYGVPVSELLPGGAAPSPLGPTPKLVIDLERLQQLPKDKAGPLARYAATIQSQRGDYNGKVLSIRQEDLRSLAVIYDKSPTELTEELIGWGVLDPEARRAVEAF
jgi:transcriptional regulator with XRE-family HTH domain